MNITIAEQKAFFKACENLFQESLKNQSLINKYYSIADTKVCLKFAGNALIPWLTPGFEHLSLVDVSHSDLTVYVWDFESTGIQMPSPPFDIDQIVRNGEITGWEPSHIKITYLPDEFALIMLDTKRNIGIYLMRYSTNLPFWVIGSPMREMMHFWMEKNGAQLVHAAAVGTKEGAVLITGKGGVGKSNTSLNCLHEGLFYLGDDYVIVKKDPYPVVYSLYQTGKLYPKDLPNYPFLVPLATKHLDSQDKTILLLMPGFKDKIQKSSPLLAIIYPKIDDSETEERFSPLSRAEMYRAISFTTLAHLPGTGEHTFRYLMDLVKSLPCLSMIIGKDKKRIASEIANLISVSLTK